MSQTRECFNILELWTNSKIWNHTTVPLTNFKLVQNSDLDAFGANGGVEPPPGRAGSRGGSSRGSAASASVPRPRSLEGQTGRGGDVAEGLLFPTKFRQTPPSPKKTYSMSSNGRPWGLIMLAQG